MARKPMHRGVLAAVGAAAFVVGLVLLGVGLAPWLSILDVFSSGFDSGVATDENGFPVGLMKGAEPLYLVLDVLGCVGMIAGYVLVRRAVFPPKPSVQELVQQEVDRRLQFMQASGQLAAPQPWAPPAAPPVAPAATGAKQPGPASPPSPGAGNPPRPTATGSSAPARPAPGPASTCGVCGRVRVQGRCPAGH